MAINIENDRIIVTNDAGDRLECDGDANKGFSLIVGDHAFRLSLGQAQTFCDWMLAKVDQAVEAG